MFSDITHSFRSLEYLTL
ncbi:CRISPR-associated DxTHG motif protein [Sporosarcina cascadiensis]